jgi:hypothetical protein
MQTEITHIQNLLRVYNNPRTELEFKNALKELQKVHNKYGTIDINIIKQLIN